MLYSFGEALNNSSATLTVALYLYANERGRTDIAFAIAAILMILTLVINLSASLVGKDVYKRQSMESTRVPSMSKMAKALSMGGHHVLCQRQQLGRGRAWVLRAENGRDNSHTVHIAALQLGDIACVCLLYTS